MFYSTEPLSFVIAQFCFVRFTENAAASINYINNGGMQSCSEVDLPPAPRRLPRNSTNHTIANDDNRTTAPGLSVRR